MVLLDMLPPFLFLLLLAALITTANPLPQFQDDIIFSPPDITQNTYYTADGSSIDSAGPESSDDQPLGSNLISSTQSEEASNDCMFEASSKGKRQNGFDFLAGIKLPFHKKPDPAVCKPRQEPSGLATGSLEWQCSGDTRPYCCAGDRLWYGRIGDLSREYCLSAPPFDCERMPRLVGKPIEGVPDCCRMTRDYHGTRDWSHLNIPWGISCTSQNY